jgi:hypothetical protein
VPTTKTFITNLQANPLTPGLTGTTVLDWATVVPGASGYEETERASEMMVFFADVRRA